MKAVLKETPASLRHRANLKRLVSELRRKPFDLLPERSVDCLNQFFSGYGFVGPPIWRDLSSFEFWLKERLFYPEDTGARWYRFIELNSKDGYDSYDKFCLLYDKHCRRKAIDSEPMAKDHSWDATRFDFYALLYQIQRKPGLYLGNHADVTSIAAFLAGYFKGKKDSRMKLTRDEKEFLRFETWLRRHHKLPKNYPWYRVTEMWGYIGLSTFNSFFGYYDNYLTNCGEKARGLEDLFETISIQGGAMVRRRKVIPKTLVLSPDAKWWWRRARQSS